MKENHKAIYVFSIASIIFSIVSAGCSSVRRSVALKTQSPVNGGIYQADIGTVYIGDPVKIHILVPSSYVPTTYKEGSKLSAGCSCFRISKFNVLANGCMEIDGIYSGRLATGRQKTEVALAIDNTHLYPFLTIVANSVPPFSLEPDTTILDTKSSGWKKVKIDIKDRNATARPVVIEKSNNLDASIIEEKLQMALKVRQKKHVNTPSVGYVNVSSLNHNYTSMLLVHFTGNSELLRSQITLFKSANQLQSDKISLISSGNTVPKAYNVYPNNIHLDLINLTSNGWTARVKIIHPWRETNKKFIIEGKDHKSRSEFYILEILDMQ